ncbi:flagellar protein G [Methanococcus maripaludis]|jgi:flagellar protein FlaG|uniref:Flagellar protein G n=3 Tax=Methanococcus maripaludis TaxID=39152 RepID=A0A8T3W6V4_METMI|nr:flagellar protein G [Methanococcus maripaludis]MBG0769269.1 flagellar protein G [Methanococcus maripaludis]BAP62022.1 flagellar accessory protein G [Methanococcus maripaludis KA1]BAP63872.1 flagellar accessory protein G [Methanococcus maripaludis OS7]
MASNVFSEVIIFVSVLIITAAVAGILATSTHKISLGISSKGDTLSTQLSQDFEIINDPGNIPRNSINGISTIYIKNTGKTQISIQSDTITAIIDGEIRDISDTSIVNGAGSVLSPSEVGKIEINYNETGFHKIKIVSENGVSRTITGDVN